MLEKTKVEAPKTETVTEGEEGTESQTPTETAPKTETVTEDKPSAD